MSQSKHRSHGAVHSLDLVKQVIAEATVHSDGKCGGDCSNCPCAGESPKSPKKTSEKETSDPCDKC